MTKTPEITVRMTAKISMAYLRRPSFIVGRIFATATLALGLAWLGNVGRLRAVRLLGLAG